LDLTGSSLAELEDDGLYCDAEAVRYHGRSLRLAEISCSLGHGFAYERIASSNHEVVLVIEDDPQALVLLRSYMEPSGYRVVAAGDGPSGITAARRERPSAILLDVLLPGPDGWEVLRQLKADPELQDIPVLMITVVDEREVGLALGAVDYLVKPIERSALLAALERHVPAAPGGRRARVLAVDDDPAALSVVEAALRDQDCEVVLAASGQQALKAARDGPIDLVICDLMMPDLDGFEVIARLKADPGTSEIPILVLTGHELTAGDKARLNGKIVGICEKGEDVAGRLRDWLATVTSVARPVAR
jgi:CheY-like chemotaxis protein